MAPFMPDSKTTFVSLGMTQDCRLCFSVPVLVLTLRKRSIFGISFGAQKTDKEMSKTTSVVRQAIERENDMSQVRVLVGTRKGAFILTADGQRNEWEVTGPHFAGWEI